MVVVGSTFSMRHVATLVLTRSSMMMAGGGSDDDDDLGLMMVNEEG